MLRFISVRLRPKLDVLLDDELYQAKTELLGQRERVHRLQEALVQAEALLNLRIRRCADLESEVIANIESQKSKDQS